MSSTSPLSLPPATRGITIALVSFSVALALMRLTMTEDKLHLITWSRQDSAIAFPWLVLVPGQSLTYPWTLLTSSFCETSLIEFCISIISIPLLGAYLERIWGSVEMIKFTVVVLVGSNIIAWFLAVLQFAVLRNDFSIYGTQYHGLTALQTGYLVGLTQMIPEHQVQIFNGRLSFQVKGLPMTYVTISTVLCLVGFISPWILIQFGWLISWVWLRFFKLSEGGMRGDRSETFSFVSWFPPFAQKPVGILSNFLHKIFVRLHIIQPWQYADLETGGPGASAPSGPSRAEAERRRAMALKALDQRAAGGVGRSGSRGGGLGRQAGANAAGSAGSSRANGDSEASKLASDEKHIDDAREGDNLLNIQEDEGDIGASH